jgi:hypothetical protein
MDKGSKNRRSGGSRTWAGVDVIRVQAVLVRFNDCAWRQIGRSGKSRRDIPPVILISVTVLAPTTTAENRGLWNGASLAHASTNSLIHARPLRPRGARSSTVPVSDVGVAFAANKPARHSQYSRSRV